MTANETADAQAEKHRADAAKANADAAKANAEARKIELETEMARWTPLAPAISALAAGETKGGDSVLGAAPLALKALEDAARQLATALAADTFGGGGKVPAPCILVTTDLDLASKGAAHSDVMEAIAAVEAVADAAISKHDTDGIGIRFVDGGAAVALMTAAPAILSLLQTKREISEATIAPNHDAAAVLTCGVLLQCMARQTGATIIHEDFRLPSPEAGSHLLAGLTERRARLAELRKRFLPGDAPSPKPETPEGRALAEIDAAITAIGAFEANLRAVPAGRRRSPLADAILWQELFGGKGKPGPVTHVLAVRAEGGAVTQDFTHGRFLWSKDSVNQIVEAAVTYMVLEVASGRLVAGGMVSGIVQAYGVPGRKLTVEPVTPRQAR